MSVDILSICIYIRDMVGCPRRVRGRPAGRGDAKRGWRRQGGREVHVHVRVSINPSACKTRGGKGKEGE